jgi:hypothetical protein
MRLLQLLLALLLWQWTCCGMWHCQLLLLHALLQ